MKRLLLALALALVAAPAATAAPLTVRTSFDDATVEFGDVVQAHVAVVGAGSVSATLDLAPLTPVSPLQTSRHGDAVELTRSFVCLTSACVSDRGIATPKLAPAQVTVHIGSRLVRVSKPWPPLRIRGRVTNADLSGSRPPFRASLTPPPPSYRMSSDTLAWLLDGAAIVLGLAALALVLAQLRRRAVRRRAPAVDELALAVQLARESEGRPAPDRRRAAGLLARVLRSRDQRLAVTARDLAWARPQPEPDALEELVGDVERGAAP
jgi:hypothetical protein